MEFRLIVRGPDNAEPGRTIQVNSRPWFLSEFLHVDSAHHELRNFTCISYVLGHPRELNPLHPAELISSNTIPALSSAMMDSSSSAFGIDALCVPPTIPLKYHTFGSMGYIYSAAEEVIITTSPNLLSVLNEMSDSDRLSEEVLLNLEEDNWVQSVWTYQEAVNAKIVYFIRSLFKINGSHFLNCLGHSLILYRAAHTISAIEVSKRLSRLDALEELLSD